MRGPAAHPRSRPSWEVQGLPQNTPRRGSLCSFIQQTPAQFQMRSVLQTPSGPHSAGTPSSPCSRPSDASLGHFITSTAFVGFTRRRPSESRAAGSLRPPLPPLPKKALVNGTESPPPHSVLASEPALCQVPSHREAPPRPQPAARASGPRAGRGLGVRLSHLQAGGGPQSGRGGPGGPGRFSTPRGGPAFGQRRGTTAPSSAAARTSGSRGCAGRKRRDPAQRPGLHLARKRGREGL